MTSFQKLNVGVLNAAVFGYSIGSDKLMNCATISTDHPLYLIKAKCLSFCYVKIIDVRNSGGVKFSSLQGNMVLKLNI